MTQLTAINIESLRVGGWGAPEVNNLVCTKRQKHINANSTHETTMAWLPFQKSIFLQILFLFYF